MNRYYVCRRIGTGVPGTGTPFDGELRPYVQANFGVYPKQWIIAHTIPWVLCKYDLTQAQHDAAMAAIPQCFSFPETALDNPLSSIPASRRNAINNKLTSVGFDTSWITLSHTIRDVLQFIAHSIQLSEWANVQIANNNFDIQTKTVADVPSALRQRINDRLTELGIDTSSITLTTPLWQVVRLIQRQADGVTPREFGVGIRRRWFYHDDETT